MSYKTEKSYYKSKKKLLNNSNRDQEKGVFQLLPIIFVIAIIPLIVRLKDYTTPLTKFPWFSDMGEYTDFFLYYKHWLFVGISLIMVLIIAYKSYKNHKALEYKPIFIPLALYAILALISSIFSKNKSLSFTGSFLQFESVFALLGYCIVVYYVYLFVKRESDIKLIIRSLLISTIILGLLGITQITGHNFLFTDTGWKLITPTAYWNAQDAFQLKFETNRVFLTLLNPNYVGVYVSLVLPILFVLCLFIREVKSLPLYLLSIIGLVISLIGSKSTTGLMSIIIAALLIIILLRRYLIKYYYISIPLFIILVAVISIIGTLKSNFFVTQLNKLSNLHKTNISLIGIDTNETELEINYQGNILRANFTVDESGACYFFFFDEDYNPVSMSSDVINGPVTIQDERFPGFIFTPSKYNDTLCFGATIDGTTWYFTNQTVDGTYYYINDYGKLDKLISAPSLLFTGYEKLASNRGYIWSRTLPLLKDKIIIGSGADTFVTEFPQNDYVNFKNSLGKGQILTKPHNLYLQIGVQTGVLSLISFIVFYLMYFISSLKLYIRSDFDSYYSKVGVSILVGTFSYMISGLANDSTITVAPLFWAFIGLGIVVNAKEKLLLNEHNNQ